MKKLITKGVGIAFYVSKTDVKGLLAVSNTETTLLLTHGHTQTVKHSVEEVAEILGIKLPEEESEA